MYLIVGFFMYVMLPGNEGPFRSPVWLFSVRKNEKHHQLFTPQKSDIIFFAQATDDLKKAKQLTVMWGSFFCQSQTDVVS